MPVLLDTVGMLAVWNHSDQWNGDATLAFQKLLVEKRTLVTTTFVVLECGNALARTSLRPLLLDLRSELMKTGRLITSSELDCELAWEEYAKELPGGAGIVDHVSFCVMRKLGITDAFTNDRHFRAAGFAPLF